MKVRLPNGKIIDNIPDGTGMEEIKSKAISKGWAKESDFPSSDFSATRMLKNIPGSAVQLGKDIITPFLHPIDTYKGLESLGKGVVEKGVQAIMTPGSDVQTPNMQAVNAVGDLIKGRYGSLGAAKNTLQNDPMGMLADVSTVVSGGASLVPKIGKAGMLANTAQKAGMAIDPINMAVNTGKYIGGKLVPNELPASLYESAAKFRTGIPEADRQALVKTALDENLMPTLKGVNKTRVLIKDLGNNINTMLADAEKSGSKISRDKVFKYIQEVKEKAVKGANPKTELAQINRFVKDLDEVWYNYAMKDFTPKELQSFKQDLYKITNYEKENTGASRATENARKATARAAKEELEALNPDIKPTNKREGGLLELLPELERSAARIENRDVTNVGIPLKVGAGGAIGGAIGGPVGAGIGAGIGAGAGILDMPKPKAWLAIKLNELRKAGVSETLIKNKYMPLLTRQLLMQSGRLQQGLLGQDQQGYQSGSLGR